MGFNANGPFNAQIRSAGNRSRAIPNIGQTPVGPAPMPQQAPPMQPAPLPQMTPPQAPQMGAPTPPQPGPGQMAPGMPNPMAAPRVQGSTFTMHPPGTAADPNQYNYEPQPDGSWRVYPPGVTSPQHMLQASLPRAASTGDYMRMSQAFGGQQAQAPGQAVQPMGPPNRPPGM
jgi:hypothetical protein